MRLTYKSAAAGSSSDAFIQVGAWCIHASLPACLPALPRCLSACLQAPNGPKMPASVSASWTKKVRSIDPAVNFKGFIARNLLKFLVIFSIFLVIYRLVLVIISMSSKE
jgi:hypothetical protein